MKRVVAGGLEESIDYESLECHRSFKKFRQERSMDKNCETQKFKPLIPGLPDDLAVRCLARVPSVASMWAVCQRWQEVIGKSKELLAIRESIGENSVEWLYTLVKREDGTFHWYAFDPLASKWHTLPPMPEEVDFQLLSPGSIGSSHSVQCVSTSKKLVMLAALRPSVSETSRQWSQLEPALEHPWVFDTQACVWRKGQQFSTPRKWCACGVVDDQVYVASGSGKLWNQRLSKSAEKYDPDSDAWESLPDLPTSKFSGGAITAVNVQGKLYLIAGHGVFVKEGVVFCAATRTWSKMARGLKIGWTGSCVSVNDDFYVLDDSVGKLNVYDSVDDEWNLFMEDTRLKGLSKLVARNGKLCGLVKPSAEGEGSSLRIIDVVSKPPRIFELEVPQGRLVSMQILSRMSCPC